MKTILTQQFIFGITTCLMFSASLMGEPVEGAENQYGRWRHAEPGYFVSLNMPEFISAQDTELSLDAEVIGVSINGDARAYPLRYMTYHHVANDTVGGEPVSVTYCVMANSAVIFERDPQSTGYEAGGLYGGVLALREIGTSSCFAQIASVPLPEENATTSTLQISAPSILTTWENWKSQHPNTKVLKPLDDFELRYLAYDRRSDGFVANTRMNETIVHHDNRLDPGEEIFGIALNGHSKAVLISTLKKSGKIETKLGNDSVTISWNEELQTPEIHESFDGYALQAYWFAWSQFYPDTEIVK